MSRISGESSKPVKKTLSPGDTERLLGELHDAVVRPERSSGCTSITSVQSSFEVSCRVEPRCDAVAEARDERLR
jgi:hypothetical protein